MPPATSAQLNLGINTNLLVSEFEAFLRRMERRGINLRVNTGGLGPQGLGTISRDANEFEKSLKAAEARVLAFGAVAGQIYVVTRAMRELVRVTIDVEKSLTDINVIFNASSRTLQKFGDELFNIAKNTGQSFQIVAKAATEFSRQGLGLEETLKRTRDALILTRLSGLDVVDSTDAITAAINSFNETIVTSTELVNKFAKVDAAFAVSSKDLAEGIKRVGSTAQDTGVSLDSLIALITSTQQITARGGAVIGNAFKTIFQRIQRPDVLRQLSELGIAVTDVNGELLAADKILINTAKGYNSLSQSSKNMVTQMAAGVFQANVFRAILSDLARGPMSEYNKALKTSETATNEAINRNKELNKTLSSLVNETFVNLTSLGSKLGDQTVAPVSRLFFNALNDAFAENPDPVSKIGIGIGKILVSAIGKFLTGPGLGILTLVTYKVFSRFADFAKTAVFSLLEINQTVDNQSIALNRIISAIQSINTGNNQRLSTENAILQTINAQNAARAKGTSSNIIGPSKPVSSFDRSKFFASPLRRSPGGSFFPLNTFGQTDPGKERADPTRLSIFAGGEPTEFEKAQYGKFINIPVFDRARNAYIDPKTKQFVSPLIAQFLGASPPGFEPARGAALNAIKAPAERSNIERRIAIQQEEERRNARLFAIRQRMQFRQEEQRRFEEHNAYQAQIKESEAAKAQDKAFKFRQTLGKVGLYSALTAPLVEASIDPFLPSQESLSGRRSRAISSTIFGTLGLAGTGAITGAAISSSGGLPGAVVGGAIGFITGIASAMKEWNNILPELQVNIDKIKDSSNSLNSVYEILIKNAAVLENPNLTTNERSKIQNESLRISSSSPFFRGVNIFSQKDISARYGPQAQGFSNESIASNFGYFIESGRRNGQLFSLLENIDPGAFDIESSTPVPTPGFANKELIDNFLNSTLGLTGNSGQSLISFLSKNPDLFENYRKGNKSQALSNIFGAGGFTGGQNILSSVSTLPKEISSQLFIALGRSLDEELKKNKLITKEKTGSEDFFNDLRKSINKTIQSIDLFSTRVSVTNESLLRGLEIDKNIEISEARGALELRRPEISPFEANLLEGKIKVSEARGDVRIRQQANINAFTQSISGIGGDTLKQLRDKLFEGIDIGNVPNIVLDLEQLQKQIQEVVKKGQSGQLDINDFGFLSRGLATAQKLPEQFATPLRESILGAQNRLRSTTIENIAIDYELPKIIQQITDSFYNLNEILKKNFDLESQRGQLEGEASINKIRNERAFNLYSDRIDPLQAATQRYFIDRQFINDSYKSKLVGADPLKSQLLIEARDREIKELTEALESLKDEIKKTKTFEGLRGQFLSGGINRDELVAGSSEVARKRNRQFGITNKDRLNDIGTVLRDEFSYNSTQFYDDLKEGAIDAAQTFKSEFSQAFKDFASGAKDAKEAFRDFALTIAGNIQGKIIDIGVDSLFGSIFGNKTKKFASGGLVTGGSGVKDDVIAKLTAGEYVVDKKTVQAYGSDYFKSLQNSADIKLTNQYDYNDPLRPTGGQLSISPFLSNFALTDENNPQNALRNQREQALLSYVADLISYNEEKSAAMSAFNKQRRGQLLGTYIGASLGFAGSVIRTGGGSIRNLAGKPSGGGNVYVGASDPEFRAYGGRVGNDPSRDSVLTVLTPGESVLNSTATNRIGSKLNSLNYGVNTGGVSSSSDINSTLERLVQSNNNLNNTLVNFNNGSSRNSAPLETNNITINVNIADNGSSSEKSSSDGGTKKQEEAKQLGDAIKAVVVQEIIKQKKIGGLLRA
jgi:TP901 family phage tail tape measure protein